MAARVTDDPLSFALASVGKRYGARPGRNPKTGKAFPIAPRRVVTFRTGQKLKVRMEAYAGPQSRG